MKMTEVFYIVQPRKDWYRLHVTATHYCLGAGEDIEALLNTVERLTEEYKNEQGLLKRLSETEDRGRVKGKTLEVYERDYKDLPHFTEEVTERVEKVLKELEILSKPLPRKNRFKVLNTETTPPVENKVKDTVPVLSFKRKSF